MRGWVLSFIAVSFLPVGLLAQDAEKTCKVEGSFLIPAKVPSFDDRTVEIRLYQFHPRIADKAADLIEKVEITKFSHTEGKDTKKTFTIGAKAPLDPQMSYYLTFFLLNKGNRTHIGECKHAPNNLCRVLTGGKPAKVELVVRPVR